VVDNWEGTSKGGGGRGITAAGRSSVSISECPGCNRISGSLLPAFCAKSLSNSFFGATRMGIRTTAGLSVAAPNPREHGGTCYDTGMGYIRDRKKTTSRSLQRVCSTSSDPQGSPLRNRLAQSRSSSARKPDGPPRLSNRSGCGQLEPTLTALSVTF
jgi:hypothetical protein